MLPKTDEKNDEVKKEEPKEKVPCYLHEYHLDGPLAGKCGLCLDPTPVSESGNEVCD